MKYIKVGQVLYNDVQYVAAWISVNISESFYFLDLFKFKTYEAYGGNFLMKRAEYYKIVNIERSKLDLLFFDLKINIIFIFYIQESN